jgi:hypothetical protein
MQVSPHLNSTWQMQQLRLLCRTQKQDDVALCSRVRPLPAIICSNYHGCNGFLRLFGFCCVTLLT